MSLDARFRTSIAGFDFDFAITAAAGQTIALLGPNGAGKTSVLRALAGLLPITDGRVVLDETVLDDVWTGVHLPPERRPIGVVFQDYLLFPHLTVADNVAFGLRARGLSRGESARQAGGWIERLGLGEYADRRPSALSGGQAQRVALARALATKPRLLLLDEPMAALDASTRVSLRRELRRQLTGYAGVRLLVTHDPVEALAMADRLLVMEGGRVVQEGLTTEVTQRPRSRYVADLAGVNLFRGRASGNHITLPDGGSLTIATASEGEVFAIVHPRSVALYRTRPDGTPRNVWQGRALDLDLIGDRVRVRLAGLVPITAEVTRAAIGDLGLDRGEEVWIAVKATEIDVYAA
ncbi:MAG TPA: ABC transporter ATP-binding protein [Candidatus Dormibacteraeota bacterium]